jgi:hypothetical protein
MYFCILFTPLLSTVLFIYEALGKRKIINTNGQLALVSCRDSEGLEEEDVVEQEDGVGHEGVLTQPGRNLGRQRKVDSRRAVVGSDNRKFIG